MAFAASKRAKSWVRDVGSWEVGLEGGIGEVGGEFRGCWGDILSDLNVVAQLCLVDFRRDCGILLEGIFVSVVLCVSP